MFLATFFQEIIFYFLWGCAFEDFVKINFHNVNKISQSLHKNLPSITLYDTSVLLFLLRLLLYVLLCASKVREKNRPALTLK